MPERKKTARARKAGGDVFEAYEAQHRRKKSASGKKRVQARKKKKKSAWWAWPVTIVMIVLTLVPLRFISDDHAIDSPDIILIFYRSGVKLHFVYNHSVFTVKMNLYIRRIRSGKTGMRKCDRQRFFF